MSTVATYTPKAIFASDAEVNTDKITIVAGQDLAELTLLMFDADGKALLHDGDPATEVAGILISAVDASAGDTAGAAYHTGCLQADKVIWPAAANTNELKQALLAGTGLSVKFYALGE